MSERNDAGQSHDLLAQWRDDLASWAIPERITSAVAESPWVLPRQVFARRADRVSGQPSGPSYERASAALIPPGSVLDVGSGAGTASLPLLDRCTTLTAVDVDAGMLELLGQRAAAAGHQARLIQGTWPATAAEAGVADVVTCHHVAYNVPEIGPFLTALTDAARRIVVLETAATHPLTSLNQLWLRFHGLRRPEAPTADDLLAILGLLGISAGHDRWKRPSGRDYASFDELVDVTRRRLCLPPARAGEVGQALVEAGIDPGHPVDLGSSGREVVTIWWEGRAI